MSGDVEVPHHEAESEPLLNVQEIEDTPVYPIIHSIRRDIIRYVDNPLTDEALISPDLTYALIKPLEDKYAVLQRQGNKSIVFCFLLNRVHFSRDKSISTITLSQSRATLCEILAIRALRFHADDMLDLTTVATTSWPLFSGASPEVLQKAEQEEDIDIGDRVGNAIELAILGKAKRFIKSSPCQKVIDGIWSGKCVYQAESSHSILSDTYKRTPVHFYNPHNAPLLDHYRLKVPAIRSVLEYTNFVLLFVLFVLALEGSDTDHINLSEGFFMVFALGFSLEKLASIQEHGIKVYVNGTWNGFDVLFISIYGGYLGLRLWGIYHSNRWALEMGMDFLAIAACLIFPRLAFVTLSNNLMILSLRSMFAEFATLMAIAVFCFAGFLYALWTLNRNGAGYSSGQIAWWMLNLWFGLDASGFDHAKSFHPFFGPILIVSYACLSNTLLLTVLVSILSYTFSTISSDAAAEAMFRRAVSTIEGVKADALFSYQPPLNLFALVIMLPASYILTPRWFHKVNVFMIRLTSFPILLCIAVYERHKQKTGAVTFYEHVLAAAERLLPKHLKRMSFFEGIVGAGADIDAVFDIEDEINLDHDNQAIKAGLRRTSTSPMSTPKPPTVSSHVQRNSPEGIEDTGPSRQGHQETHALGHFSVDEFSHNISPLAQVFVPLQKDNNGPIHSPTQTSPATGVTHSSTIRRRNSSMLYRRMSDSHTDWSMSGAAIRASADEDKPKTVDAIEREEEHLGGEVNLEHRLARMEERQKRIEDMMIQLIKG